MALQQKQPIYTLKNLNCNCGGELNVLPDEEASAPLPTFDSKLLGCIKCKHAGWYTPQDFNFEFWDEIEEFKPVFEQIK